MLIYVALFSCGVKNSSNSISSTDTQNVGANASSDQQLNGTVPTTTIALPEFTALNSDGLQRTQQDLLDQRTVLWFYPITGTPG
jgi:hypothetical protein